jgi:predicted nucleotidyltransferase
MRRNGKLIPMAAIRRLAREIGEKFQPERVILFGSYAYGEPNEHSDVDILVVMPAANEISQAIRIRRSTEHPFPLDLIVRTPETLRWRLEAEDWFLKEIVSQGRVLRQATRKALGSPGGAPEGSPGRVFEPGGRGRECRDFGAPEGRRSPGLAEFPPPLRGCKRYSGSLESPGSQTRPGLPSGAPPGLNTSSAPGTR